MAGRMRWPDAGNWAAVRGHARRYAAAWIYLAAVTLAEAGYAAAAPPRTQAAVVAWASTNPHNLAADPVGCLVASAFLPGASLSAWPALIALGLFGANRVLGNWRTAAVCAAGHVAGTAVSEGIVAYRVGHGLLPAADWYLTDVGPSYVVVTAIVVTLLAGGWLARVAAALDLALLIVMGDIFGGLSTLAVAPVGHVTAMSVGAVLGGALAWRRRGRPAGLAREAAAE